MEAVMAKAERVILVMLAALLAFITIGIFIQVALRYVAGRSFLWGEELSGFAFVWCIFLGAAVNVRRRSNFAFEFLLDALPPRWGALQRIAVDLVVLACVVLLIRQGWIFAELSVKRLSPALGISLFVPAAIIPATAVLMLVSTLLHLGRDLRQLTNGKD